MNSKVENRIEIDKIVETHPINFPDPLGFGRIFSDRMFIQRFSSEQGWHDAEITAYQQLSLDPASTVFHNGQMIFDGTKAYRSPNGDINLFRPQMNVDRFNLSAERMGMPTVDPSFHLEAIKKLVKLEQKWVPDKPGTALYIRPTMISSEKNIEVRASREYLHFIILTPVAPYFAEGFEPVAVAVSENYIRSTPGGTGEAKTPGNYAGSIAATEKAIKDGYQQVLWLDGQQKKYVDEVGAMNIAFVKRNGDIVSPSLTGAILRGVTRDSLATLAPSLGHKFIECRISIDEVVEGLDAGNISEIFGMGTGAVIAPVGRLLYKDREIIVSDGKPGPVATKLYKELTSLQYGIKKDPFDWIDTIKLS